MSRFDVLGDFLLRESRRCIRPPVCRFAHPWLAPMPLSDGGAAYLRAHGVDVESASTSARARDDGPLDVFNTGDYSLGLFHHDASEASIELLEHEAFADSCRGSLLNMLDTMSPSGLVHRVELVHKSHEDEPSKPVIAQWALRCANQHPDGGGWLIANNVYPRVASFIRYLEREYTGKHGLFLAHSALQTGFDNDLLSVSLPDKSVEDPGISAFMVLEYEALAELATLSNQGQDRGQWLEKAARTRYLMNELMWFSRGDGRGFYVGLQWRHGVAQLGAEIVSDRSGNELNPICTWVGLLPLYAGVPNEERAREMVNLLTDPFEFWGPGGVRTMPLSSVYFNQSPRNLIFDYKVLTRTAVSNWQGPVWILSNFYIASGLARYGFNDEARDLSIRTAEMCLDGLEKHGSLHECYNDAGAGLWPAEGGFISWNVLLLTMLRRFAPDA